MDRTLTRNSFSLKHRILGDDGFIILVHLGSKGIRSSTNNSKGDATSGNGNSNGSTSRDTSNQTKVEGADEIFVTWSSTTIGSVVDITFRFGTVVSLVTWSGSSSTSLDWMTRSQEADILVGAICLGVLTSFGWVARFVGTHRVIVTEDVKSVKTSFQRITSIDSTDTIVITDDGVAPSASGNSRRL